LRHNVRHITRKRIDHVRVSGDDIYWLRTR